MPDFLERELERHLAPVRAPETLWEKIDRRRHTPVAWNPGRRLILFPALALIVLTVAAGAAWKTGQPAARTNPTVTGTSDSCPMCHTGATLYVTPPAE
jgi:rubredoxin